MRIEECKERMNGEEMKDQSSRASDFLSEKSKRRRNDNKKEEEEEKEEKKKYVVRK